MNTIDGKRCLAAIVGLIVVSVVTVILKYTSADYIKLAGIMYSVFVVSQTITDIVENKKENEKNS